MRLILIRHGETEWNREKRIQGHLDSPLTAEGVGQAVAGAARLKEVAPQLDAVISSDSGRALRTAELLTVGRELPIERRAELRERSYGIGEGLLYAEMDERYPTLFSREKHLDPHFTPEGGESRVAFHDRIVSAFARLAADYQGQQVLVVSHGGVLGVVYRWLNNLGVTSPHLLEIPNLGVNVLTHSDPGWRIETWGDTSHLRASTVNFV